jgi:NlpC/P60 family putative phage cell wall peptidase
MKLHDMERELVVQEAKSWLGTPYHHHGRIKGVGVDCAQFLACVYEAVGLVEPVDTGFYPIDWHLHHSEERFSEWMAKYATLKVGHEPEKGDVLLWRFGRTYSHGSIYIGEGLYIHSYLNIGVMISTAHEEPLVGRKSQHWSFWS